MVPFSFPASSCLILLCSGVGSKPFPHCLPILNYLRLGVRKQVDNGVINLCRTENSWCLLCTWFVAYNFSKTLSFYVWNCSETHLCLLPLPFVFVVTVPTRWNLVAANSISISELCVIWSHTLILLQTCFFSAYFSYL